MKHTYSFVIYKPNKPLHKVIKSSLSTKLILSESDAMAYCQQKALDLQINPDTVSLMHNETGKYVYKCSSLVNSGNE